MEGEKAQCLALLSGKFFNHDPAASLTAEELPLA